MDAVVFQFLEKGAAEFALHQGFAAGQGHAAAGLPEKQPVLQYLFKQILKRNPPPGQAQRPRGAGHGAQPEAAAPVAQPEAAAPVAQQFGLVFAGGNGLGGAGAGTAAAVDAQRFVVHKLRQRALRFRVAAPGAAQRAAFEKNQGADAVAVVQAEALNIEYNGFHIIRDVRSWR